MNFTPVEQKVLNRVQRDIPFVERPFVHMADETGLTETEFITSVKKLKEDCVIRNIAGIFNTSSLGYRSCLAAISVAEGDAERAAGIISSHPGVSHNYLRAHRFNIWFTLALPAEESLDDAVRGLAARAGATDHIILRTVKMLKIGVHFAMGDDDESAAAHDGRRGSASAFSGGRPLTIGEKEAVRLLQCDLPLEERAFRAMIEREKGRINETMLLDIGDSFKERGMMRRYSAVLRHRKAGYGANAMTAWKPGVLGEADIVRIFGAVKSISHLYLRETTPGRWEHPLFAMIHAKSDEELDGIIAALQKESGIGDCLVLRTLREFKKERVRYFSPEFERWKTKND
ncbi:MAG: Lrp/AsnC family transcriptional regulator [Spirochaetes bacterium]|nr:Lrp/AsnC family transcriptional regulator [Spirochaetota bacterium]